MNGEYWDALAPLANEDGIGVSRAILSGTASGFRVPHWFLEMAEWELLLQASEKAQLPVLRMALGLTSLFRGGAPAALAVKEHFIATCIIECFRGADGDFPVTKFQRVVSLLQKYPTADLNMGLLNQFQPNLQYGNFVGADSQERFLQHVRRKVREDIRLPSYDQTPFAFDDLEECVDFAILYEEAHGNRQIRDYCSSMVTRLKSLQDRAEYAFLRHSNEELADAPSAIQFLTGLLGLELRSGKLTKQKQIAILDMNDVEDEVVELVSAVTARMLFKLLRRADPRNRFPIHLLLEEAHRYVAAMPSRYAIDATKGFERIAKEGRKYGMFIVLASQRPSEISKTVLSQCSNFVVHRIQNPDDLSNTSNDAIHF